MLRGKLFDYLDFNWCITYVLVDFNSRNSMSWYVSSVILPRYPQFQHTISYIPMFWLSTLFVCQRLCCIFKINSNLSNFCWFTTTYISIKFIEARVTMVKLYIVLIYYYVYHNYKFGCNYFSWLNVIFVCINWTCTCMMSGVLHVDCHKIGRASWQSTCRDM